MTLCHTRYAHAGLMIKSFFTEAGSTVAHKQIRAMALWGAFSFVFDAFKWVWRGSGELGRA